MNHLHCRICGEDIVQTDDKPKAAELTLAPWTLSFPHTLGYRIESTLLCDICADDVREFIKREARKSVAKS